MGCVAGQSGPDAFCEAVAAPMIPTGGLCDSRRWLLWKVACLRGAPSALAARLPPEPRLGARPGSRPIHPLSPRFSVLGQTRAFMSEKPQKSDATDYSKTLFLPQTEFPMRA